MNIKFTKINDKAIDPKVNNDGSISIFAADLQQAVDGARKPVLVYHTGITVEMDNDYVLLMYPGKYNVAKSLSFESDHLIDNEYVNSLPADEEGKVNKREIIVEYKVSTDAMPVTYTMNEEVARLFPIQKTMAAIAITTEPKMEEVVENVVETVEPTQEN